MSIAITPDTDPDTQVTEGDRLRIAWELDVQVDPKDLAFTVRQGGTQQVFSGGDLTETRKTKGDGSIFWEYYVDYEIQNRFEQVDFRLRDPVNNVRDTAHYTATSKVI